MLTSSILSCLLSFSFTLFTHVGPSSTRAKLISHHDNNFHVTEVVHTSHDNSVDGVYSQHQKMIKAILVFNNQGKPRLIKFFVHYVSRPRCQGCVYVNSVF